MRGPKSENAENCLGVVRVTLRCWLVTDDIARQRFWSENNAKPDPAGRRPRMPRSAGPARRSTVEATHVLLVKVRGVRDWRIVADTRRDVAGSEAFCRAELATRSRHFPDDEFRVLPWSEARRELRRKTWSVRDEDHIPIGNNVLLRRAPAEIHPSLAKVHIALGMSRESEGRRTGVVTKWYRRSGDYMVKLDGTELTVCVARADLICPVPDNERMRAQNPYRRRHSMITFLRIVR